ncbi:hypothetical protein Tco_0847569, partial [Tanacetum coccineum]
MVKVSRALLTVKIRCNIPRKPTTIELTTKCSIGFQLHDRFQLGMQHSFQLEERLYRSQNTVTSVDEMYNVTLHFAEIMFTDVGEYNSLGTHIYIQGGVEKHEK